MPSKAAEFQHVVVDLVVDVSVVVVLDGDLDAIRPPDLRSHVAVAVADKDQDHVNAHAHEDEGWRG